ncbi:purine-nucleoside phosphorylase [Spiroplasma endosymbiont of Labia minor]|uniref:purine-nucleoside phosphorylase n=1 Tax=Spiroplasma endosymbiont of Labia minor TaxID=3066305 RepID=UPI0030CF268A
MTPHIHAKKNDIAKFVLMPGDPLRAKKIAETFLDNYKLVNDIRNMFMYTGYYNGVKVTIAGSGMGMASISIYSYELFKFYDVDCIIRVGSAGSYTNKLKVYDIVNTKTAFGETNIAKTIAGIDEHEIDSSPQLFDQLNDSAKEMNIKLNNERVHSSDVFYRLTSSLEFAKENNLACVEMEAFALFANAKINNKQAACLLTISDSFVDEVTTTPNERQHNFLDMVKIALNVAEKYNQK